jgi:hypothetical protein
VCFGRGQRIHAARRHELCLAARPCNELARASFVVREGDILRVAVADGVGTNTRTGRSLRGARRSTMLRDIVTAGGTCDRLRRDGYL